MRRSRCAAALVATAVLGTAACSGPQQRQEQVRTSTGQSEPSRAPEHIHAVVVDDDKTYLATHEGVFALVGGRATRVSDQPFDAMSLAASRGVMMASGHPAPGTGFPDPLGLGVSSDGGRTWRAVSRLGETDFHDVELSGEQVWAVSADGVLWRSQTGGRRWTSSDHPAVHDLVVDPADDSIVVALSAAGVVASADGGTTLSPVDPQPASRPLKALRVQGETLVVTETGEMLAWSPGARVWDRRGVLPAGVQAVGSSRDGLVAVTSSGLYRSSDGGRTFELRSPIAWP